MKDDGGSPETYEEQIARQRKAMSPVALSCRQRIGIGLVIIVVLVLFGGLTVGGF
jgi:hypothetical protein